MTSVNFTNHEWLAQAYDTNKNGVMDELKTDSRVKNQVDTDRNGQISRSELVSALKSDAVEINKGVIQKSQGFNLHVNGLETLKNVRATSGSALSNANVYEPHFYDQDLSRERYMRLVNSNNSYDSSIASMESSLKSIVSMTNGATDATSRALNIQARTALDSTKWRTWTTRLQSNLSRTRDIFDGYTLPSYGSGNYKPQQSPHGQDPFKSGGGSTHGTDPFKNGGSSGSVHGTDPFKNGGSQPVHGNDPFNNGGNNGTPHGQDPFNNGGSQPVHGNDPFDNDSPHGKDPFNNGGGYDDNQPIIPDDPYLDRLDPHIREQEMINTNLKVSYETLRNTLSAIKKQTNDLPDMKSAASATDKAIAQAFRNVVAIQNSGRSKEDVVSTLNAKAEATAAQATGRTGPFAGVGAGIGAVGGGLIGFFAGGKSVKSAAIGAGVGAAVSAGIGALIGNSIDSGYVNEAQTLKSLADDVSRYNPETDKQTLLGTTQKTYNELIDARNTNDLDGARVHTNNFNSLRGPVESIQSRSAKILSAYQQR